MKYFFLSEGWTYGRVWEFGGLWNRATWRRAPEIKPLNYGIIQNKETLWLYEVEDAVIMLEVKPVVSEHSAIGQVVLKRLISPEQVINLLQEAEQIIKQEKTSTT
ncbi:MAG: hypothetical protein AAGA80_00560 [Cyanobacteria bacterium P01_F01_bin.143]